MYFVILIATVAILGAVEGLMPRVSEFVNQAALSRQFSQSGREVQNALGLVEADLNSIMSSQKINSRGLFTNVLCKQSNVDCHLLPLWGLTGGEAWVNRLTDPNLTYYGIDGDPIKVRLLAVRPSVGADLFRVRIEVKDNGSSRWEEVELFVPQSSGNGLSNALVSEHNRCLMCHVTIFGNVMIYSNVEMHETLGTKIHGALNFAGSEPQAPVLSHAVSLPHPDPAYPTSPVLWTNNNITNIHQRTVIGPNASNPTKLPTQDYPTTQLANNFSPHHSVIDSSVVPNSTDHYLRLRELIVREFNSSYQGVHLPFNFQRQKFILPKVNPHSQRGKITGTLTAQFSQIVPLGGSYPGKAFSALSTNQVIKGHLILLGTTSEPIQIDGDVSVEGDVLIAGWVSGKGSITSGRNIYIFDDIRYVNPPAEFDASAASNAKMSTVSYEGADIALTIPANRDRLALFASNSIFIGNPFYNDKFATLDQRYIGIGQMPTYAIKMGMDQEGTVLDAEDSVNGGAPSQCYLRPWEAIDRCGHPSLGPIQVHEVARQPANVTSDYEWYLEAGAFKPGPIYKNVFMPFWITKDDFYNLTKNQTKIDVILNPNADPFGGRDLLNALIPMPVDGLNLANLNSTLLVDQLQDAIGIFDHVSPNLPILGPGGTAPGTLKTRIQEFFDLCLHAYKGTARGWVGMGPYFNALSFTRFNPFSENNVPFVGDSLGRYAGYPWVDGFGAQARKTGMTCAMWVWPESNGTNLISIDYQMSTSNKYAVGHSVCNDHYDSWLEASYSTTPTCTLKANGTSLTSAPDLSFPDAFGTFPERGHLRLVMTMYPGPRSRMQAMSRWWDPAKAQVYHRINHIDGLLFANQFIVKNSQFVHDSQLRVNGGLIAKELLGLYLSPMGLNSATGNYSIHDLFKYTAPALWVVHDPRMQYVQDIPASRQFFRRSH